MIRLLASVWPYRLIRWLLAGVFLYAGVTKLTAPQLFAENISDFGLVPENILFATALAIIGLEVLAGFGLLLDIRGALAIVVCLLVLFVVAMSYGLAIGLDIDCGCFGPGDRGLGLQEALLTDLCLLAACGYLYWSRWVRSRGPTSLRKRTEIMYPHAPAAQARDDADSLARASG
jgi:sodium--glutamate symport carrier gltS